MFFSSIDEIKAGVDGDAAPRFVIEPIVATETLPNVTSHGNDKSFGFTENKSKSKFAKLIII